MPYVSTAALAVAAALLTTPAFAQTPTAPVTATPPVGSVGSTVTGDPPARAGSTSAVGRTKPPGAAADGSRPDLDVKSRQLDRKIKTGICRGC